MVVGVSQAMSIIAKVVALTEKNIKVKLENGSEFEVDKVIWESKERVYNRESRKIESKVCIGMTTRKSWILSC